MIIEKFKMEDMNDLKNLYSQLVPFENNIEKMKQTYAKMIDDKRYLLAVAKENDRLVGTALAVICGDLALSGRPFMVIESVVVDEKCRGKGIGKKIIEYLDDFAINNNVNDCIIVSSANRINAHKFYYSMGFTDDVVGFRKNYN